MKIAIMHNRPADGENAKSSLDVLAQVEIVEQCILELGFESKRVEARGKLRKELDDILNFEPDIIFNLVETIEENPLLYWQMAAALELLHIPFTGSGSASLALSANKHLTKLALRGSGTFTPDWKTYEGLPDFHCDELPPPWLVKPNFEDASIGIDDDSIYKDEQKLVSELPALWEKQNRRMLLIEQYIDGREFNISLLDDGTDLEMLPAAEIDFSAFAKGKPKIVGYRAKWDANTFEYKNTPRKFIGDEDEKLTHAIKTSAKKACAITGASGYVRVDFRISHDGTPFILEINTNPCLAGDGGFMAAARKSGKTDTETIERILKSALRKGSHGIKKYYER